VNRVELAVAAVIGVPLLTCVYVVLVEKGLGGLPPRWQRALRPWLWLAPALAFLIVFLVYPTVETIRLSFYGPQSVQPVGLANYTSLAIDPGVQATVRNNLLWLIIFTTVSVGLGLVIAVLTDRQRYESVAKAVVFLPMAVSFVGASVIWKFIYDFQPAGSPQTGLLNAVLLRVVPGFVPQAWLIQDPLNNLALIAVGVWVWAGFCTVILSAALKGLSRDVIEAARVDGANAWQIFRLVTIPLISPTIAVVATTMVIFALKAFDIVYVMTSGNFDTDVLANRMYTEMFTDQDFGRAAAIAVILLIAIIPVMLVNVRRFRRQEEQN
jgi:alpha-glucoside transport system permease protein